MRTILSVTILVLTAGVLNAATIHVPADQPTIQAGIDAAVNGDTVLVAPGVYIENIRYYLTALCLISSDGASVTTIQAANPDTAVVSIIDGEPKGTELNGFTITGSNASGISCKFSSPTVRNNHVTANFSDTYNRSAGINMSFTSGSLIQNNIISGNGSSEDRYGPAIQFSESSDFDTVSYNVLFDNVGVGDIRATGLISGMILQNNTISVTTHSGLLNQGYGSINAKNNIVFFSKSHAFFAGTGGDIVAEYNCTFGNFSDYNFTPGAGNIYQPALFVDTTDHDYRLLPSSPCINAGDPDPQYNDPDGTRNDMGAIPFDASTAPEVNMLLIEGSDPALNVTSHTPLIEWSYTDPPEQMAQSQFEIAVGTDNDWQYAEMWNPAPF